MVKVADVGKGTVVISTKRKPNPAAQAAVKLRKQQEQQIVTRRAAGTEMGQTKRTANPAKGKSKR